MIHAKQRRKEENIWSQVGRAQQVHESRMQIIQPYFRVSFLITKQMHYEKQPCMCDCAQTHTHFICFGFCALTYNICMQPEAL